MTGRKGEGRCRPGVEGVLPCLGGMEVRSRTRCSSDHQHTPEGWGSYCGEMDGGPARRVSGQIKAKFKRSCGSSDLNLFSGCAVSDQSELSVLICDYIQLCPFAAIL